MELWLFFPSWVPLVCGLGWSDWGVPHPPPLLRPATPTFMPASSYFQKGSLLHNDLEGHVCQLRSFCFLWCLWTKALWKLMLSNSWDESPCWSLNVHPVKNWNYYLLGGGDKKKFWGPCIKKLSLCSLKLHASQEKAALIKIDPTRHIILYNWTRDQKARTLTR